MDEQCRKRFGIACGEGPCLGSGDLCIRTMGGQGVEMNVMNVLFVGAKMNKIQRLIATKPDCLSRHDRNPELSIDFIEEAAQPDKNW